MLNDRSPQPEDGQLRPKATGNLWAPSVTSPTTVPVPLPVVVVRVDGPFTALDRKLWLALVHIAFPNLSKPGHIHEIAISEIIALFRKVSKRRDLGGKGMLQLTRKLGENTQAAVLWQSIRRLAKTTIEWGDDDYMGINSLIGARMDREARTCGKLYFTFDPLLAQHVLAPRAWARLNVHVVMKLRSKYAVTLYEVLEAHANRDDRSCVATIEEVRAWLKVPDDAYGNWKDFRRNVIEIAVSEINTCADMAGFSVAYEGVREGRAFAKVRFITTKTSGRQERETLLRQKAHIGTRRARTADFSQDLSCDLSQDPEQDDLFRDDLFHDLARTPQKTPPRPSPAALDTFRRLFPENDPQEALARFQEKWRSADYVAIQNPDGAFLKFAKGMVRSRAKKAPGEA